MEEREIEGGISAGKHCDVRVIVSLDRAARFIPARGSWTRALTRHISAGDGRNRRAPCCNFRYVQLKLPGEKRRNQSARRGGNKFRIVSFSVTLIAPLFLRLLSRLCYLSAGSRRRTVPVYKSVAWKMSRNKRTYRTFPRDEWNGRYGW